MNTEQESIGGLSSVMALGYLNLSNNPLPLESLRPLARAHILELCLGSGRSVEERRRTLAMLPHLWVLDEEFVTAQERRIAEDKYHDAEAGVGIGNQALPLQTDSSTLKVPKNLHNLRGNQADNPANTKESPGHQSSQQRNEPPHRSAYGDLEVQGRQARSFYEDVVWRLPSR